MLDKTAHARGEGVPCYMPCASGHGLITL